MTISLTDPFGPDLWEIPGKIAIVRIAEYRVFYSFNRGDFCRIHSALMRAGQSHAGIILAVQQRYSVGEQMRRLLRLISTLTAEEMRNRIDFLSAWS